MIKILKFEKYIAGLFKKNSIITVLLKIIKRIFGVNSFMIRLSELKLYFPFGFSFLSSVSYILFLCN